MVKLASVKCDQRSGMRYPFLASADKAVASKEGDTAFLPMTGRCENHSGLRKNGHFLYAWACPLYMFCFVRDSSLERRGERERLSVSLSMRDSE